MVIFIMRRIQIFDLDGTLTTEFNPLWNSITERLVKDSTEFHARADAWKKDITSNPAKYPDKRTASKDMTEIGLKMFREEFSNSGAVVNTAKQLSKEFLDNGVTRLLAIEYLKYSVECGDICVISTASYSEGAEGFLLGLVEAGLIPQQVAEKIIISGNVIDWSTLTVTHMNVDDGKIKGLEETLKMSLEDFRKEVVAVFGDDPAINDRAILEIGKHGFVIPTSKNLTMSHPVTCVRASWEEILYHKNDLPSLFHLKKNQEAPLVSSTIQYRSFP